MLRTCGTWYHIEPTSTLLGLRPNLHFRVSRVTLHVTNVDPFENFCLLSDQIWGFGPNMGFWKRMNFTSCFVKQYCGIIKGFSRIPMEEEDDEQYFGCSISHVFNSYDLFPFSRKIWYLSSLHPWQNIELGCMKVIYINCALKISSLL